MNVPENEGAPRKRGRPRAFDEEAVLRRAMLQFRQAGLDGTSVEDLVTATGLNRASLYGTFTDKEQLYLRALALYAQDMASALGTAFSGPGPAEEKLRRVFDAAMTVYDAGGRGLGCMASGTAVAAAHSHPSVRAALAEVLRGMVTGLEAGLRAAGVADPALTAELAGAVLTSLALRLRAGEGKAELHAFAQAAARRLAAG